MQCRAGEPRNLYPDTTDSCDTTDAIAGPTAVDDEAFTTQNTALTLGASNVVKASCSPTLHHLHRRTRHSRGGFGDCTLLKELTR